jgi:uncharacterized protein YbjT (DUF2867 family)
MKRVLVTGASGFIGRHCLPLLVGKGYEVHAVARRRPAWQSAPEISWHESDLLQPGSVSSLLHRVQPAFLLHLPGVLLWIDLLMIIQPRSATNSESGTRGFSAAKTGILTRSRI